jgi:hypothetical protein
MGLQGRTGLSTASYVAKVHRFEYRVLSLHLWEFDTAVTFNFGTTEGGALETHYTTRNASRRAA